ncbi:YesL family protein [Bacillus haikouensis]|uniref:YesL family protein n=1 Tax=Bacillus haikouensis TaxID=1510468 RepID=UPI0015564338|nr:YesL family protein [Bacillus haikouensis]NQD66890.1 YesL family protein [Bacillus haikouensis]
MGGWDRFNTIVYGMLKLAYLNLLWILFTFTGLVMFGLFPATIAMFAIVRKWLHREDEVPVFHTFWAVYKKEFIQSNGYSLLFIGIGYILYYDFTFISLNSGRLTFLVPVLVLILIGYIITLLFFFPVYVHFDLPFFKTLKQTLLIALTSPFEAIQILVASSLLYGAASLLPGIIPLFTGSVLSLAVMWISLRAFEKVEKRKMNNTYSEQQHRG